MPGDRRHHTEKFRRCVQHLLDDGKEKDSAYAICTASFQEAGNPLFEGAEMHHLHLCGATGVARTEILDGKEHLVVPVVALMEGVIHAVNAETPEFVPLTTLQRAATSWNGRPVVLYHPVDEHGRQCSANSPKILESHGIGQIFNSRVEGNKLLQEAWIEKAKAKRLHPEMYARLEANKPEEVSVGAWVLTDAAGGEFKNKKYKASWIETTGDHLAFLPGGRGACSMEMGCGAHRAAMHLVTAEGIEPVATDSLELLVETFKALAGARHSAEDVKLIQAVHDHSAALGAKCDRTNYRMMEGYTAEHTGSHIGNDNAAAASAPQLRAACGCQGAKTMDKTKKAELIAALVIDKHSGFKEGDEPFLETASDEKLEEFRSAADARKSADEAHQKLEHEQRNTAARLKVAEDRLRETEERLKVAAAKPTKEQWLENAPPEIKALLEQQEKQNHEHRSQLVTQLKAAQAEFTEDDLNAMDISMLERMVRAIRVETPDFSGRGVPVPRQAASKSDTESYAPPNPYEAGIKALQEQERLRSGSKH